VGIGITLCVILCDVLCDILCETPEPRGARRDFAGESLALQAGPLMGEFIAKHDILLSLIFVMACSDLWVIHQR
jgi:hypothetical protein